MLHRRTLLIGAAGSVISSAAITKGPILHRGIGVNCFDLFYGPLVDERGVRAAKERLAELADLGIPFVRFAASPFWPKEWRMYPLERYYRLMETIFSSAERSGIGLVPSVFWNPASVSDLVNESVSAWGQSGSRTLSFAKRYAEDLVTRFGTSNAIWHWEFGNEFNLNLDLQNVSAWWPKVNADMGTPAKRVTTDSITTSNYSFLISQFANWVQTIRPNALISTGSDIPRPNAWNTQMRADGMDSPAEFRKAVCTANPIPGSVASIHLYPDSIRKYFSGTATASMIFTEARAAALSCGQRLIVGEFGVKGSGTTNEEKNSFENMLTALEVGRVDMAALWVYDFERWQPEWSVTRTNAKAWQLKEITSFNARQAQQS